MEGRSLRWPLAVAAATLLLLYYRDWTDPLAGRVPPERYCEDASFCECLEAVTEGGDDEEQRWPLRKRLLLRVRRGVMRHPLLGVRVSLLRVTPETFGDILP